MKDLQGNIFLRAKIPNYNPLFSKNKYGKVRKDGKRKSILRERRGRDLKNIGEQINRHQKRQIL